MAPVARALGRRPLDLALHGGEDYELLFTVPRSKIAMLETKMAHYTGCTPHRIGTVAKGRGVQMREGKAFKPLRDGGYEHFRG